MNVGLDSFKTTAKDTAGNINVVLNENDTHLMDVKEIIGNSVTRS